MTEMKEYPPGTFCWPELATKDAGAAKNFYTKLLGWTAEDSPVDDAGAMYTMLEKDGKDVGALYPLSDAMHKAGVPSNWLSYVSVSSADDTAAKARAAGATVVQQPFDVMTAGRMAVIQDPTGAIFALWQANENIGAELVNEPGSFCWNELQTHDTEAAEKFYGTVFGWTPQNTPSGDGGTYTVFSNGDRQGAGMIRIREEWGEVPPNWAVYFAVENCDDAIMTAKDLGGTQPMPPMEVPGVGRFALLCDPLGARFFVIQLDPGAA